MQHQAAEIGKARVRKEDARLVTGQTNWTDNMVLPGMLHMAFVRSPYAHARITGVDLSAARAVPGVVAVFSGADFADEQGSLPCAWPVTPDIVIPDHPRWRSTRSATSARRWPAWSRAPATRPRTRRTAVDVDYEPLPAVLDIRTALDDDSPKVHEAGNKSYEFAMASGDVDAAFRDAPW